MSLNFTKHTGKRRDSFEDRHSFTRGKRNTRGKGKILTCALKAKPKIGTEGRDGFLKIVEIVRK